MSSVRPATHAGSWYSSSPALITTLQQLLSRDEAVPGTKHLISPHAGYKYCGDTMALGYSKLDFTNVKRCIIMGPSHHIYFKNKIQVTSFDEVNTPFGDFKVDGGLRNELLVGGKVVLMSKEVDMDEHSLEMQFPMLWAAAKLRGVDPTNIKILPLLVSHNSTKVDFELGKLLQKYVDDEETLFILSSDFCHWGRRFGYTGYVMESSDIDESLENDSEVEYLTQRSFNHKSSHNVPIYKSIEILDQYAMDILGKNTENKYYDWKKYINVTGNTICGERPIGVFLCAMSLLNKPYQFNWAHYSQSSQCVDLEDSSVSYASGYF
ncbi:Mho1p [Kluyveromyces lactis]|uniref:KLLA0A11836p n=1 Tax=Kluyveromyces lactis (strain ATCC 8585 / CBS 2359 / DSM 70799 / NBRC 1267 / NRRL Y-1140 / WM37) TaxID=284590 RepID=Q6CX24_KLULA|nr:uncharacterized protein KLLA0_A11836g [Kluyveromyces lactis]CAH03103.1 KLLA0A11836p [Kluyveromyces lactis]|eukprot:XP_451515.1 uncharacterized protein KLLA0_A11836g [Kluyveromyces lactis]